MEKRGKKNGKEQLKNITEQSEDRAVAILLLTVISFGLGFIISEKLNEQY